MSDVISDFGFRILDSRRGRWAVAALVALLAAIFVTGCGDDGEDGRATDGTATPFGVVGELSPESSLGKQINAMEVPEASAEGRRLGPADATVAIEAYEDFGCPHCLDFTANIEPALFREYVATGKVSFEYKYFPLRQVTAGAALAAQCAAEQDKFWPVHRALFIAQAEANEKVGPSLNEAFSAAALRELVEEMGVDINEFDACIAADTAFDVVQADLQKARELNLPGTPAFVINGKVTPGPDSVEGWRDLLDELLK